MMETPSSWHILFNKPAFKAEINLVLNKINALQNEGKIIYPAQKDIFKAFHYCKYDELKVVIFGQDPYHGEGQAEGLAFSVPIGQALPPSLKNIFKELSNDLKKPMPTNGNLERWAQQGVLLLNSVLTVESKRPGSHRNFGWENISDQIIKMISDQKENIVFILWGNYAINKMKLIDTKKHLILTAAHPSPLSAYKGFFGCQHFSKTNEFLKAHKIKVINW